MDCITMEADPAGRSPAPQSGQSGSGGPDVNLRVELEVHDHSQDGRHNLSQHRGHSGTGHLQPRGTQQTEDQNGSMIILVSAPTSWVHMASVVRPVDWSSRSKQNWLNTPTDNPRQIRVYCVPISTISGTELPAP